MRGALLFLVLAAAGCTGGGSDHIRLVFDPCDRLVAAPAADATAVQVTSVEEALGLWNAVALTALAMPPVDGAPSVPIQFQKAAGAFFGLYDDARGIVFINQSLTDGHERAVTIAHELGHSFGLVHVSRDVRPSVMNAGNLTVEPTAGDVAALAALWGACPAPQP